MSAEKSYRSVRFYTLEFLYKPPRRDAYEYRLLYVVTAHTVASNRHTFLPAMGLFSERPLASQI